LLSDEPWGYTPLEAIAFKVPCITTDLAGFGLWANTEKGKYSEIEDGVKVLHRTDYLSRKALWSEFIIYYEQAYDIALKKAAARNK